MNLNNHIYIAQNLSYKEKMRTHDSQIKSLYRKGSRSNNYYRWYWHSYRESEEYIKAHIIFKRSVGKHYNQILSNIVKILPKNLPDTPKSLLDYWGIMYHKRSGRNNIYHFDENMILRYNQFPSRKKRTLKYTDNFIGVLKYKKITVEMLFKHRNNPYLYRYIKRIYANYTSEVREYNSNVTKLRSIEFLKDMTESTDYEIKYLLKKKPHLVKSKETYLSIYRSANLRRKKEIDKLCVELDNINNGNLSNYLTSPEYYTSYKKDCHHVD